MTVSKLNPTMNQPVVPVSFRARAPRRARTHSWRSAALGCIAFTAACLSLPAATLYIPNASFESPAIPQFGPVIDSWIKAPQPGTFDPNVFGSWDNLAGLFVNFPGTPYSIDNAAGNQLAFLFSYPQVGLTQTLPAKFQPNKTYTLTVGLTTSLVEPLTPGATLALRLNYLDASTNLVTLAATTVTFDTNVFSNPTHLVDFQVAVTNLTPSDAAVGRNISLQFESTVDPLLLGGVWDLENVRLTEAVYVPNASFEAPVVPQFGPVVDVWTKAPQPPTFDPNVFGSWDNLAGLFVNFPGTPYSIDNAAGNQLAFLFSYPQVGLFQDLNARFEPGAAYTFTAGLTTSIVEPLTPGAQLLLSVYYRDGAGNPVTLGATTVTYATNVFTNATHLLDFSVSLPGVRPSDPWAGKPIGVQLMSIVDPFLIGGVWDVENVRLVDTVAPALVNAAITAGQFQSTVRSEPGMRFEVLASTDLATPVTAWTSLGSVTNTTGTSVFTDAAPVGSRRFYTLHQLP